MGAVERETVDERDRLKAKKQVSDNQEGGQESRMRMKGEEGHWRWWMLEMMHLLGNL